VTQNAENALIAEKLRSYYLGMLDADILTDLQEKYNAEVWNDAEFDNLFSVHLFENPIVRVIRRADGVRGTVAYLHNPRLYFCFIPELIEDQHRERQVQEV
jgi:hypothetical protein